MHYKSVFIAALCMFNHGATAMAAEYETPRWALSGFGTVGAVHSDESKADFTSSVFKSNGAGYSRHWSMDVDSRVGAQLIFNITPDVSATVQTIAEQRFDNSYRPIVEWANVKYQMSPDLSLRAGRIALPSFLAADYRKVGYAIPWARTPLEVYSLVPITNSDGVDLSYRSHHGALRNTVQVSYGTTDAKIKGGAKADVRDIWGISNTLDYGAAALRLTYMQADVTVEVTRPMFNAFRQFGATGNLIADKYDLHDKRAAFFGVGLNYDPGAWFVMAEHGTINTRSYLGDRTAWYISGGYRLGNVTPYLAYGKVMADSSTSDPGLATAGLPPPHAAVATNLNAALNTLLGYTAVQTSTTAGARWDLMKSAAVKVQYDRVNLGAGSQGLLINAQPGFRRGGKVNIVSIVFDFVF